MILKVRGKKTNLERLIVGRITFDPYHPEFEILISDGEASNFFGISKAIMTSSNSDIEDFDTPAVIGVPITDHLTEGDIVVLNTDGVINTLYRINSDHNFLLFTERCNSNCLMCSQPPKDRDDTKYYFDLYQKLIPLIPKSCKYLGITGGEPTLLGDRFIKLLALLKEELPETEIHCLTNGRTFGLDGFTKKLAALEYKKLVMAIPLYADVAEVHDYVVQSQYAFHQTIRGIYNLARYNIRTEIRIVLHKQTIPRLKKTVEYIYKNMPFVEHVALMGLEIEGYTPHNLDKLWIDPYDYQDSLADAVKFLATMNMPVSIYNLQLCILPRSLWKYARKSISDWKNIYMDQCKECGLLQECGGLFKSAVRKHSKYIEAF